MASRLSHVRLASRATTGRIGSALPALGRRAAVEGAVLLAFCAAILATNYALASVPNVKLFDLMVFVAGYTLGFRRAALVTAASWGIYGTLNPWGATTLPLLLTVSAAELAYALAGVLCRRLLPPERLRLRPSAQVLLLGSLAVASTLAYDVATNVFTGISWAQYAASTDYGRWVLVALFNPGALWFSAMHIGSNVAAFAFLAPLLVRSASKARELLRW